MATAAAIHPDLSEAANPVQAFGHEFDLLVACCADSLTRAHAHRIRELLSSPLDWQQLLQLVDHHRVVPQIYGTLSAFSHLIPTRQLDALRSRYQENARNALWFTAELQRILSYLESAGIPALPYKGPVLAKSLYGEVTQRQFNDLDILIRPADVPKAKSALLALGYPCSPELRPQQEPAYIASGCGYVFHSPAGRNLLDLQWRIVPRFYSIDFDVADFLKRADEIGLATQEIMEDGRPRPSVSPRRDPSCPVRTLCAEDLLLVLCVHAAKHVWIQLSWLCDIAQLATSQPLDWNAIQDEARRLGIERIVHLNLLLAHQLLGSAMPPQIQKRLQEDPSSTTLADEILPLIERSTQYNTESIPYFRLMLRLRERREDQARFLCRLVFTPSVTEWSTVRLPKFLRPLYRLVRLARLAKRLRTSHFS